MYPASFHRPGAVAMAGSRPVAVLLRRPLRIIINADQLVRVLEDVGYSVVHVPLEELPLPAQVDLVHRASLLVGVHGAGLANGTQPSTVALCVCRSL